MGWNLMIQKIQTVVASDEPNIVKTMNLDDDNKKQLTIPDSFQCLAAHDDQCAAWKLRGFPGWHDIQLGSNPDRRQ